MRMRRQYLICLTGALLALFSGCVPTGPGVTPSPMPTTASGITSPPVPPTVTPSLVLPTRTPLPTKTPTPTPRPWFVNEREYAFLRELLETNGGCELPCWWGITLGETTWEEAKERLITPGLHRAIPHPALAYDYCYDITLRPREGIIQTIHIQAEVFPSTRSERFARDWRRYSLDQVLTRYGMPSQVMLELWPNPPGPYYPYRLFIFYDHLGILIGYTGSAVPGEPLRVCPRFEEMEILDLWLQSPERGVSLLELADLDPLEEAQMLPLEDATGMDVSTFYETFRQAGTAVCLESPAEVWP